MLSDAINFLGKLSFRKILNIMVVRLSLSLSNVLKSPVVWGRPWFVSIEPASVCNLSCPQCPVGKGDIQREKKFMDIETYRALLDELRKTTAMLSLYFQGEPLMHSRFMEFVRMASERKIYTQTSTNAQLLSGEVCRGLVSGGLDRILISLDGIDQESYGKYRRGGELQKVEEAIRTLNRVRREAGSNRPFIIVQFLVLRHNREQVPLMRKRARQLGADRVKIKSAQVEYPGSAAEWIPEGTKYARYEKNASGEYIRRGKLRNRCSRLWQATVITSDGMVVPCCFDKLARYPAGRTGEADLARIWKNESYQDFRRKVLVNRKGIAMCRNCTEGTGY